MPLLDITTYTSQGVTEFVPQTVNYPSNPRNSFVYDITFLKHNFDFETRQMSGKFRVIRSVMNNGVLTTDISYIYDSIAKDDPVDQYGDLVSTTIDDGNGNQIPNPAIWGTEFSLFALLYNAQVSDGQFVQMYQQILFDRGVFDFPKQKGLN